MPMPPYPVLCYRRGCGRPAVYKIASAWSDSLTAELKTYALSCAECLAGQFRESRRRQSACRLTHGEKLDPPGIHQLARGQHDQALQRLPSLEQQILKEESQPQG
jgi:hypothetical protein